MILLCNKIRQVLFPPYSITKLKYCKNQTERCTSPERRQRVHTYFLATVPFSITFTLCTLGAHFLFVLLLEWETLFPETTPLWHTSQNLAISHTSSLHDFFTTFDILPKGIIKIKMARKKIFLQIQTSEKPSVHICYHII